MKESPAEFVSVVASESPSVATWWGGAPAPSAPDCFVEPRPDLSGSPFALLAFGQRVDCEGLRICSQPLSPSVP